jgi:hypothetical protein
MKLDLDLKDDGTPDGLVLSLSLERIVERDIALRAFALRFLDPEDLGYVVNARVRDDARQALGMSRVESLGANRLQT